MRDEQASQQALAGPSWLTICQLGKREEGKNIPLNDEREQRESKYLKQIYINAKHNEGP